MGYTTEFTGQFLLDAPLTAAQCATIVQFSHDDHRDDRAAPGAWCQWVPTQDGTGIEWDQNEKFYEYTEWLEFLIERFLKPWGRVLSGRVAWQGEDGKDQGVIHVRDNQVRAVASIVTEPDPAWQIEKPEPTW